MERPAVPVEARAMIEVWTTATGVDHEFHVADGEDVREVAELLVAGVSEILAGKRSYALDDQVWLAQFVLRGKQVGCGFGTLDADPSLLRHSLGELTAQASVVLETAADRRVLDRRLEILEAMARVVDRWDVFSALVGASVDRTDARRRLEGEPFHLNGSQAEYVLDISIARRTRAAREALRAEITAARADLDALG